MNVVVAMDSFKGSLSGMEAGNGVKEGILKTMPDANVCVYPLADGGEGTVEALVRGMNGKLEKVVVTGPLDEPVECTYGILEATRTAVIEMAGAAGITLVPERQRNPLNTTTYGVGEVIKDAIQKGCRHFIVGIGGSATNDGGVGMLQALGYDMLDGNGKQVVHGAKGLEQLVTIRDKDVIPELKKCDFRIACDVVNPLCGENGCSTVFGPQKGATPTQIALMDQWLASYAKLTVAQYGNADASFPGSGAAGGMGFAFLAYMNAKLESGVKIVLEETRLEEHIRNADLVVTGEGRLDGQTILGKAPIGVAKLSKKYGKRVLAFAGSVTEDAKVCNAYGIDAFFPVVRNVCTLQEAMDSGNAKANIASAVEQVFRVIEFMGNGNGMDVMTHYDLLIDENNDPFRDTPVLQEYMNQWDGELFIEALELNKNKKVLEIGIGTGRIAVKVAPSCMHLTGIDISPKTIERAKENLKMHTNISYICEDFVSHNFMEVFDVIYSSLTMMHFENKSQVIAKVVTLLRDGGIFCLSIDKCKDEFIDMGTRKVKVYPDNLDNITSLISASKMTIINVFEINNAYIIVSKK